LELFLATRNEGKIREIRELLKGCEISLASLRDYPDAPEVAENGETYRDNALTKARFFTGWTGKLTMADDSGLEVDYLQGRPGVFSIEEKNRLSHRGKALRKLKKILKRYVGA
jgi:XTP/dITP diphosphohydrolase